MQGYQFYCSGGFKEEARGVRETEKAACDI
jgi:hypothetical protein